jgi:hypothetical protein
MFEGLSGEALSKAIQREFSKFDTDGTGLLDRCCVVFCSLHPKKSRNIEPTRHARRVTYVCDVQGRVRKGYAQLGTQTNGRAAGFAF